MPSPSAPDPIDRLLALHAETRRRLHALADAPETATGLAHWLDGPAHAADDILEQRLFPALIESMAGSDAVCLKGMTGGLARERADLNRRWRQSVRPALENATADPGAAETRRVWIQDMQDWLSRADTELLPMAARLLDDEALDALAADCAGIDAA